MDDPTAVVEQPAADPAPDDDGSDVSRAGDAELRLPPAPQFTPGQIDDLGELLGIVNADAGDRPAVEESIRIRFFADKATSRPTAAEQKQQQLRLAGNTLTAMANYGLLDLDDVDLSELGAELLALPNNAVRLDRLAQHILADLHGREVVAGAQRIQARGEPVTKDALHDELSRSGFNLPRATTHHTSMGQWLRAAGVLTGGPHGWTVDDEKFEALTGVSLKTIDEWSALDRKQQAFLRTLRRILETEGSGPIVASTAVDRAEQEHGKIFKPDQLRKQVFVPLEAGGWVTMSNPTKGRGGKSGTITPTAKLLETDFEALTGYLAGDIPADVRARLGTPLSEIYADLDSSNQYVKGLALELLAMRLTTDLNLAPVRFRQRGIATGGAELDLVAEGAHLHFSRWLFQCKNTRKVNVEDLAREVGMATLLRAHVIVIATTGDFTRPVKDYATELAKNSPLQVVLLPGSVLSRYREAGANVIADHFHSNAREAMRLKRPQVDGPIDEISGGV